MNSNRPKKSSKNNKVKFLLAPRSQKDPLVADYEAPQNVLIPKDGADIEEIKKKLPDFDTQVFASKDETRVGMLERAHNADGITFDSDILVAMSKDFNYEDPNNILDDDFMDQAGGMIQDEGEMLDGEMSELAEGLFEEEPEVIDFNNAQDGEDVSDDEDDWSDDSDQYDIEAALANHKQVEHCNQKDEKDDGIFSSGRRLVLVKKKDNKAQPSKITAAESARKLQDELNAHFNPQNQRMMHLKKEVEETSSPNDEDDDDDESNCNYSETKSVFTNYSMTSSVMRRGQGLQQIDEHFERLYEKEYADDTEIGALDLNDVRGEELLSNVDQIRQMKQEIKIVRGRNHGDDYQPEIVSDHYRNAIIGDDSGEEEDLVDVEVIRRENKIDCESILSYNSNLYNHPKLIIEPRRKLNSQNQSDMMDVESDMRSRSGKGQSIASSRATVLSKLSIRPDNETTEERRTRKKALKEYRHQRRQERKQNQQIFKSEQDNLMRQQRTNQPALKLA